MDLATFEREQAINQKAYETLREEIRRDYAGQYVTLAQGRVIAASPDFDEALAAVQRLQPVPEFYLVFPADDEPVFEPFYDYEERS